MNERHAQSDTCISERRRLFQRLDQAARGRVTIITAPDGYGKTTLLRSWAAHTPYQTDFLSLRSLNVPSFVETLCNCCPPDNVPQSIDPDADPLPVLVDILNGLAQHSDQWVLILDDYSPSPQLDDVLCFLIEYLPPYAHLIIAGEEFPHISCLPRMRVRRELHEITGEELLFEAEETCRLIEVCAHVRAGRDEVQRLLSQTRGHAAELKRQVRRVFLSNETRDSTASSAADRP